MDIKKSLIYDAFEDNEGLLNFNQVKQLGLSYYTLNLMLANEEIYSDERGLYSLPNVYVDEWFGIQHRFPKGIFSLDSALWLHGLSLTVPFQPTLSFPYGTNTKKLKLNNILPIVLRTNYDKGIEQLERQPKQFISLYSRERTLAECLRPIYKMDIQLISIAFQMYFKDKKYNVLVITGDKYYEQFSKFNYSNVKIVPYMDNLINLMKDSDLIVSRAGASIISEITSIGMPSILVPSPYVSNNHQYKNALSLESAGAAVIVSEEAFSSSIVNEMFLPSIFGLTTVSTTVWKNLPSRPGFPLTFVTVKIKRMVSIGLPSTFLINGLMSILYLTLISVEPILKVRIASSFLKPFFSKK